MKNNFKSPVTIYGVTYIAEIRSIREKSPEINRTEVEYPDSLTEYECLEQNSRSRSQTEDYNDSDEDMLSNLYSSKEKVY